MYVVDTHNCVPVWQVSDKLEVGAYTLRPKIHKLINEYLVEPELMIKHPYDWSGRIQTMKELEPMVNELLSEIAANGTNIQLKSGESAAKKRLEDFIAYRLDMYGLHRNDPSLDSQSDFSPYLHFGQISSLRIALRLREEALRINSDLHITHSSKMPKPDETVAKLYSINALIEEMIVRKELADNFCFYTDTYDSLDSAPGWARASLDKHRRDSRPYIYSYEQLEKAQTHDPAWNACQTQMRKTGKMHGYMRMYWAKKILEWTESPDQAIDFLVRLNDFYSVDGGDPSGYAGILWSVGGVHDRPWQEREVFGVIRYMNYAGLKRKFAIEAYQNKWLDDTAGKTATLNI
jgi:deoxyribodipyrimidine photo-lyase